MPLYRMSGEGTFVSFERTPFPDVERVLEDWIQANPHLLLPDETIAFIGRQVRTEEGKILDLLGIDRSGATVVVELKRGETPREVVAQALEYAAWVDSLSVERLDDLARTYGQRLGGAYDDVASVYRQTYLEDTSSDAADNVDQQSHDVPVTFNDRQRIVIVAEEFTSEVERALRYLRTRHGVDVTGVQFGVHKAGAETIVETELVVGRERQTAAVQKVARSASGRAAGIPDPDEAILAKVQTDFMRRAVTAIEDWVESLRLPALTVRHSGGSDHDILWHGKNIFHYYYAKAWLFCRLYLFTPEEEKRLRTGLSKPETLVSISDSRPHLRFHVATDADWTLVKSILLEHLREKV